MLQKGVTGLPCLPCCVLATPCSVFWLNAVNIFLCQVIFQLGEDRLFLVAARSTLQVHTLPHNIRSSQTLSHLLCRRPQLATRRCCAATLAPVPSQELRATMSETKPRKPTPLNPNQFNTFWRSCVSRVSKDCRANITVRLPVSCCAFLGTCTCMSSPFAGRPHHVCAWTYCVRVCAQHGQAW